MTFERAIEILETELKENYGSVDTVNKACRMGIDALKMRMPEKPLKSNRRVRYCEVFDCPNCGFSFSGRVIKYCYKCGQALDWRDV